MGRRGRRRYDAPPHSSARALQRRYDAAVHAESDPEQRGLDARRIIAFFRASEYEIRVTEDGEEKAAGRAPQPGIATLTASRPSHHPRADFQDEWREVADELGMALMQHDDDEPAVRLGW